MRAYTSLNSLQGHIHFPSTTTEGDIQAELSCLLKQDGFSFRSQVPFMKQQAGAGCIFDIVIFKGRRATAIIEIKSPIEGPQTDLDASHQGLKYRSFGVPVILFWDLEQYHILKEFLKNTNHSFDEQSLPKSIKGAESLKRLHKSLDIASMAAYDLGRNELVITLERQRDAVGEEMK
jgi:hypothetical protein